MKCISCPNQDTIYNCFLCKSPICVNCETKLRGNSICPICVARLRDQKAAVYKEESEHLNCPCGFLLGLVMAVVTAIAWSQIALLTKSTFTVGSLVLGGMVGYGVMRGAGDKRGYALQQIACFLTLIGAIFAYSLVFVRTQTHAYITLSGGGLALLGALYGFPGYLSELSPLAWLFVIGGTALAYHIPRVRALPDE